VFGITVGMPESQWLTVILQKLYTVTYVKPRQVTVILVYPPLYQTSFQKI
jgi:hypothetical protein